MEMIGEKKRRQIISRGGKEERWERREGEKREREGKRPP